MREHLGRCIRRRRSRRRHRHQRLAHFGDLAGLEEAAKAEGALNVIALPRDWANYGAVLDAFSAKYPEITITEASPDASSAEEIQAAENLAGPGHRTRRLRRRRSRSPSANTDQFAPYKVETWDDIPDALKEQSGLFVGDYGGYMAVGYDPDAVPAPTSLDDLLGAEYKGKVAINGDPTQAGRRLRGRRHGTVQNGGTLDDFQPGIDFFSELNKAGNFVKIDPTPATIASGETPVVFDWDYLNVGYGKDLDGQRKWEVVVSPGHRIRRLLQPGHQRRRSAPGRRSPVAGVPLQRRGAEPVARRWRTPRSCRRHGRGRNDRREALRRAPDDSRRDRRADGEAERGRRAAARREVGRGCSVDARTYVATGGLHRAEFPRPRSVRGVRPPFPRSAHRDRPLHRLPRRHRIVLVDQRRGPCRPADAHHFCNSIGLSALTAVIGSVVGAACCYALIGTNPTGLLRSVVDSTSGVLAQFGGVMLAFAFVATIGIQGMVTVYLKDSFGIDIFADGVWLYELPGLILPYIYFQVPLMIITFLPALEGLKPASGPRPTPARGLTRNLLVAHRHPGARRRRSSAACCCSSPTRSRRSPRPPRSPVRGRRSCRSRSARH